LINVEGLRGLAAKCATVAAGLDTCVKYAHERAVREGAAALSPAYRRVEAEVNRILASVGSPAARRGATSERLRWEWLASTGALLDGVPDRRLLVECVRHQREALDLAFVLGEELSMYDLRDGLRQIAVALDDALATAASLVPPVGERAALAFA